MRCGGERDERGKEERNCGANLQKVKSHGPIGSAPFCFSHQLDTAIMIVRLTVRKDRQDWAQLDNSFRPRFCFASPNLFSPSKCFSLSVMSHGVFCRSTTFARRSGRRSTRRPAIKDGVHSKKQLQNASPSVLGSRFLSPFASVNC